MRKKVLEGWGGTECKPVSEINSTKTLLAQYSFNRLTRLRIFRPRFKRSVQGYFLYVRGRSCTTCVYGKKQIMKYVTNPALICWSDIAFFLSISGKRFSNKFRVKVLDIGRVAKGTLPQEGKIYQRSFSLN